MVSIQETKEVSNIFVAEIFLELLANIFDTFIFDHTVEAFNRGGGIHPPLCKVSEVGPCVK